MHKPHSITTVVIAMLITGCSKSSSPQREATIPTNPAEVAAFMTNSLDVLQAKSQVIETNLQPELAKLDKLRRKYNITDASPTQLAQINQNGEVVVTSQQPYWDEKRKVAGIIAFQRTLALTMAQRQLDENISTNPPPPSAQDREKALITLKKLLDEGVITPADYEAKRKALQNQK